MNRFPLLSFRAFFAIFTLCILPTLAHAHPGHDGGHDGGFSWDFTRGFEHPLFGLDHMLAMIAVGLWAAQSSGRARWLIPATFISVMSLGGVLGARGFIPTFNEQMIAASLLVFGLLLVIADKLPLVFGLTLTAFFAAYHGFAHGAEIPVNAQGGLYGLGFIAATALLHTVGFSLGQLTKSPRAQWIQSASGIAVALIGVLLLID
jgi:urease accessory protein